MQNGWMSRSQLKEFKNRQKNAAADNVNICRRCFKTDHHRNNCTQAPVVACSSCYKLNVFTTSCCQRNTRDITDQQLQTFRFAGFPVPRMFIDLNIFTKNIPALVCTGLVRSKVNLTLAKFIKGIEAFTDVEWVTEDGIDVPIYKRGNTTILNCKIENLEPGIHMVLGMDYIMSRPFRCTFDNITLNSRANWAVSHHEMVNYAYNLPRGNELYKYRLSRGQEIKPPFRQPTFKSNKKWKQYFSHQDTVKIMSNFY